MKLKCHKKSDGGGGPGSGEGERPGAAAIAGSKCAGDGNRALNLTMAEIRDCAWRSSDAGKFPAQDWRLRASGLV
jgi:hypothetical protein